MIVGNLVYYFNILVMNMNFLSSAFLILLFSLLVYLTILSLTEVMNYYIGVVIDVNGSIYILIR